MVDRVAIQTKLTSILSEYFEIAADEITPDANLYEDLDLDSIDAIDLVVKLQGFVGQKIEPDDFKAARTVDDVINILADLTVSAS